MSRSFLARFPDWIRSALNLQDPELPSFLSTDRINLTLDAYQGGWGNAVWPRNRVSLSPSLPATNFTQIQMDRELVRIGLTTVVEHQGGSGPADVRYKLVNTVLGTANAIAQSDVPVDGTHFPKEFFGAATVPLFVVPPLYELRVDFPATVAGEAFASTIIYGEMRAGFKPI